MPPRAERGAAQSAGCQAAARSRPVWYYKDACYAFRQNGQRVRVWKSTPSGWVNAGADDLLLSAWGTGVWQFCNYNFLGRAEGERNVRLQPCQSDIHL